MSPQHRELIERLFEEALTLPRDQHAAFLAENCPDFDLRDELQSLLAFATEREPSRVQEAIAETAASLAEISLIGQRVGPYRLTGRIGLGGMGFVYRAVRADDQFQQTVAIKMLRFAQSDWADKERFRRERQILANLDHPHIARLLDGGTWIPPGTGESQPYIVMEYVKGLPLIAYCEQHALSVGRRLELFRHVCEAVSYAHQRLVVHRDIKPSNVLVTLDGTPKLLDFGIAKLLDPDKGSGDSTLTASGLLAMTPDYASPEQVRGDAVSTMSDVYSLGAVLYEMLTLCRPHQISDYDPLEIARAVCDREVDPPSARGGRELRGDIDVIVLKAMQKDQGRRYTSVEQLSEDIRRYLYGLPILARPDNLAYRAVKFARRHRLGLAGAATVLLALLGAISVSTWEAIRAARAERSALVERDRALAEKQRADTEAATSKAVAEFLQNDLLSQAAATAQASPDTKPDPDLKVRTALDRAATRIAGKFDSQPLVEASIRQTIGKAYQDLGLFPEAQRQFERALEIRQRTLGEQNESTLNVMNSLGELYWRDGKYDQSERLLTRLLELQQKVLGEDRADTLKTMSDLGTVYEVAGQYQRAEQILTKVFEGRRRIMGPEHPLTLDALSDLAVVYLDEGRFAEGETRFREVLEARRRTLGDEHPHTLESWNNLAVLYAREGKYREVEQSFTSLISIQRRVLGENHPDTLRSLNSLGRVYVREGRYREGEKILSKLVDAKRRILGPENHDTLITMSNLAELYFSEGKYDDAERLLSEVLEISQRTRGRENPRTLSSSRALADVYRVTGRYSVAENLITRTLETQKRVLGNEHPETLLTMDSLAELHRGRGQDAKAAALFATTLQARRRTLGERHADTIAVMASLGAVKVQLASYTEAESLLREALSLYRDLFPDIWRRYQAEALLGKSLAGQKNYARAEPLLRAGYQGLLKQRATIPASNQAEAFRPGEWIVQLYSDAGKPQAAAEWQTRIRQDTKGVAAK